LNDLDQSSSGLGQLRPGPPSETEKTPASRWGFCFSVPSAKEATVPISLNNL
jgi:hypothetical protein